MEFISAEEFLKQPEKVQKALKDWFKDNIELYDLYTTIEYSDVIIIRNDKQIKAIKEYGIKDNVIPLFTEGQLRKFIEDETKYKMEIYINDKKYMIMLCKWEYFQYQTDKDNLLEAYWEVACKIIAEKYKYGIVFP